MILCDGEFFFFSTGSACNLCCSNKVLRRLRLARRTRRTFCHTKLSLSVSFGLNATHHDVFTSFVQLISFFISQIYIFDIAKSLSRNACADSPGPSKRLQVLGKAQEGSRRRATSLSRCKRHTTLEHTYTCEYCTRRS